MNSLSPNTSGKSDQELLHVFLIVLQHTHPRQRKQTEHKDKASGMYMQNCTHVYVSDGMDGFKNAIGLKNVCSTKYTPKRNSTGQSKLLVIMYVT